MTTPNIAAAPASVRTRLGRMIPRALLIRKLHPRAGRRVLLTFDDGPHPQVTPAVLDRLDAYGAKAVFFVVGRRIKHAPDLVREIHRRGHVIGNHSYLHRLSDVLPSRPRPRLVTYYADARRCQAAVAQQTQMAPTLFRPPGGRVTWTTLAVPRVLGMRCVKWSQDVEDWRFSSSSDGRAGALELLRTIAAGDIVLLHDNNPIVLDLLDLLLPGLCERQYDLSQGVNFV